MTESNKIAWGWTAAIFVVFHCSMIFIYAFPQRLVPLSVKNLSSYYVYPVFEQTWSLFAPCPTLNSDVEVNYFFEGDSTGFIDPLKEDRRKHAMFRFTHHGDLALGESNLLFFVASDVTYMSGDLFNGFPADSASVYYKYTSCWQMEKFVYGTSYYLYSKRPDSAYVKCAYQSVKTLEEVSFHLPTYRFVKK